MPEAIIGIEHIKATKFRIAVMLLLNAMTFLAPSVRESGLGLLRIYAGKDKNLSCFGRLCDAVAVGVCACSSAVPDKCRRAAGTEYALK